MDIKKILKQLRDPRAKEFYKTVSIDTITIAADLAERYICQREQVENIKDIPYGQGFKMVAQEIQETLREITMLGFGLILTAHSKETPTGEKDAEGNPIMMAKPDLSKNVYTICNAVCDLIGYIKLEHNKDGTSTRYIYTRSTPTVFAGSRWQYLEPKLPFSYNDLVKGISDAIDKSAQHGATVVDHVDTTFIKERSFDSIMSEAKDLWMNYLNIDNEEEQEHRILIVKEIIRKIFGNAEFKLSQATPGQSELVELFCDEMKSL